MRRFSSLDETEERVEFVGLDPATLRYESILRRPRQSTYSRSKAARLVRIAFEALDDYGLKQRRNVQAVPPDWLSSETKLVEQALRTAFGDVSKWRAPLIEALDPALSASVRENRLHELISPSFYQAMVSYGYVREAFAAYMTTVGAILAARFDDDHAIKLWDEALGTPEDD